MSPTTLLRVRHHAHFSPCRDLVWFVLVHSYTCLHKHHEFICATFLLCPRDPLAISCSYNLSASEPSEELNYTDVPFGAEYCSLLSSSPWPVVKNNFYKSKCLHSSIIFKTGLFLLVAFDKNILVYLSSFGLLSLYPLIFSLILSQERFFKCSFNGLTVSTDQGYYRHF